MSNKALLCGINAYKHVTHLRGCINDVRRMSQLLKELFGFQEDEIRTLTDEEVTKAKIQEEWKWLTKVKAGDRILFHFSGHGSFVPDDDDDEDGGDDEIICLYDMEFGKPNTFLRDDEINKMLAKVPKDVHVTVVMDNCHSGTNTRQILVQKSRSLNQATGHLSVIERPGDGLRSLPAGKDVAQDRNIVLARFVMPPDFATSRSKREDLSLRKSRATKPEEEMNHLLLAACRDDQTAADAFIDSSFNGAFTFNLCKAIRDQQGNDSVSTLDRTKDLLRQSSFDQVPQHEGIKRKGSLLGGGGDSPPKDPQTTIHLPLLSSTVDLSTTTERQKLIDTIHKLTEYLAGAAATPADKFLARAVGRKIVYVHGISTHVATFSDDWFKALRHHTNAYGEGILGQTRFEVLWSNLVNNRDVEPKSEALKATIREALEQELREREEQEKRSKGINPTAPGERDLTRGDGFAVDDFLVYMASDSKRQEIINRFTSVTRERLQQGDTIDIVAHSWGTVVAYEGLRELERGSFTGRVRNFFTVGSALSMRAVQMSLRAENKDFAKPKLCDRWYNLDAQGDLVGGRLKNRFKQITDEFLDLVPGNCAPNFLGLFNIVCAHSSYFQEFNEAVNRDILALIINNT